MFTVDPILTEEERDVLVLISSHPNFRHLTNKEIGQRLGISVTRVKTLIHQACVKLGARNRNEAVLLAVRRGEMNLNDLLSLDELAEILCSVNPDVLRMIAKCIRHKEMRNIIQQKGEQIPCRERRRASILTNRERDVLSLVGYGLTNEEIADKLCMSTSSVRTFLNRAFKKLGARKRSDAVQLALKRREITVNEVSTLDEMSRFLVPLGAESIEKIAQILDEKLTEESISTVW